MSDDSPTPPPTDDGPAGAEGVAPQVFVSAYEGQAPWDTGAPQPEVLGLLERGALVGPLLDIGCGSGENALAIAQAGHAVTAIDLVPRAIEIARHKASTRGVTGVVFDTMSALDMPFDAQFDTGIDTGVFHVFSDEDRVTYREVVHRALRPGASLHVVVFSEHQPGGGPRRVSQAELRETFAQPLWEVVEIAEGHYDTASGRKLAWRLHARRR